MLASAERTVDPQAGFDRGRLQETLVLRPAHAPVVAGEDDERVLRRSDLIEGDEEAGDALVKLVNPIAEGAGRAFPGEVLVGRDGVVHRDRREIEQEGLVLGLGLEPGGGFVGEHLHHALVLPSRRVQFENLRLAVFGVLRPVARLIIVAVSRGSGDLHARGNLSGAQAVHEAVFDVDARQVAVITRDAEVIVEADVQRPRGEFGLVIRAPLRVFVLPAVTQMPFADGGGAVAFGFEQGGQVDAGRLDVQGRERAEHFMRQRGAPAVATGEQRIAGGRADGGRRIAVGETATFGGEPVDRGRADQLRVRAVAAGASVAVVIGEDDDDIGSFGGDSRQREQHAEEGAHGVIWRKVREGSRRRRPER